MSSIRILAALMLAAVAITPLAAEPVNETLQVDTASGKHTFKVEMVRSKADMEKGLMFRRYLPEDRGMLFNFGTPQAILMWMKNTYLPLDMVFIDPNGKVIRVAADAEPLSEATISSGGPALGVLEINAGIAKKIDLKAGDTVAASIFPKR